MRNLPFDEQALHDIRLLLNMGLDLNEVAHISGYDLTSLSHIKHARRRASPALANVLRETLLKVMKTMPLHVLATCNDPSAPVNDEVRLELATALWTAITQALAEWRRLPSASSESACKVGLPRGILGVTAKMGSLYLLAADSSLPEENQRSVIIHEAGDVRRALRTQPPPTGGTRQTAAF